LSTHDIVEADVDGKLSLIDGKATNRIVVSRNTANTARLVLARTTHGLRVVLVGLLSICNLLM
jgi:hypothetical protein